MSDTTKPGPRAVIQDFYDPGFRHCFGCGRDNPHGLRLECWQEGAEVVTAWSPPPHYQGPAGALHGGITALLMDEVGSAAAFVEFHRRRGDPLGEGPAPFFVTAALGVDYLAPVTMRGPVELRAWTANPDDPASRKAWIECVLRVQGEPAAKGRMLFVLTSEARFGGTESVDAFG